ncbi:MAG: hypothetical protein D6747_03715 [Chlorobiota bacterium]|jgi:hypothetical protein|nr:MAG: hypothetical protein D6747_03715 [Chlorobiota bacterium]
MQLRALAAYQQAAAHAQRSVQQAPPARKPEQLEYRPAPPAPLVVELFNRNGRAQIIATGIHVDQRI